MKAIISGVATIPNIYKSEGGKDVAFRGSDVIKLSEKYVDIKSPMVINHDEDSFGWNKGTLLKLGYNEHNQLTYEAEIDDEYVINNLVKLEEQGKIPNVSPMLVPNCDTIEKVELDDGSEVYYSEDWDIQHLSIVNKGRCDDSQGCGVHKMSIVLMDDKPTGDKDMSDEIKLELEALKTDLDKLKAEKEAVELKLTAMTEERDAFVTREMDEVKALILTHNKEAKFAEDVTLDGLKIVLGALEDNAKGMAKASGEGDEKSASTLKLEAIRKKREEAFRI